MEIDAKQRHEPNLGNLKTKTDERFDATTWLSKYKYATGSLTSPRALQTAGMAIPLAHAELLCPGKNRIASPA